MHWEYVFKRGGNPLNFFLFFPLPDWYLGPYGLLLFPAILGLVYWLQDRQKPIMSASLVAPWDVRLSTNTTIGLVSVNIKPGEITLDTLAGC